MESWKGQSMSIDNNALADIVKTIIAVSSVVASAAPPSYQKKGWYHFVRLILDGLAFNFGTAANQKKGENEQ